MTATAPDTRGAKALHVAPIAHADADAAVRRWHYSGSVVRNSQVHLGVFWDGRLEGAMQFGPSLDKRKLVGLVDGTPWHGFIELNRMAFGPALPRNSESRALAVAFRLLRRAYPQLQWVVSFADATQCGDGTIYRAAGFVLTQVRRNTSIWSLGDQTFTDITYRTGAERRQTINRTSVTARPTETGAASMAHLRAAGARPLDGWQLRYLYFLDPSARARLTVPVLPFARIAELGAGMYLGRPREVPLPGA